MADSAPINWEKGVAYYGGDEEMFKLMLESYENLPFNNYMKSLSEHILALDYQAIKTDAQSIKGVSTFIAAERCQHFALELKNSATEENEAKVVENYLALSKEGRALKTYIAGITNGKFNAQDYEKYERDIKKKYNRMTSSQASNTDIQRQASVANNQQIGTKKSIYAEIVKTDPAEPLLAHNLQNQVPEQNQNECQIESVPQKQAPVCCNSCNMF